MTPDPTADAYRLSQNRITLASTRGQSMSEIEKVAPPRARATPPGGAPDEEVAALMEELSNMQTWAVMLTARSNPVPGAREAMDLIQRTRCLIVERLYPANLGRTINAA